MHSLFEEKDIAGNIVHAIATKNAIIARIMLIKITKLIRIDSRNYIMTYYLQHPSRKMLLILVEPFET